MRIFGWNITRASDEDIQRSALAEFRRLSVRRGDVLVFTTKHILSDEQEKRIRALLEQKLEGVGAKVLVLTGGDTIEVVSPTPVNWTRARQRRISKSIRAAVRDPGKTIRKP